MSLYKKSGNKNKKIKVSTAHLYSSTENLVSNDESIEGFTNEAIELTEIVDIHNSPEHDGNEIAINDKNSVQLSEELEKPYAKPKPRSRNKMNKIRSADFSSEDEVSIKSNGTFTKETNEEQDLKTAPKFKENSPASIEYETETKNKEERRNREKSANKKIILSKLSSKKASLKQSKKADCEEEENEATTGNFEENNKTLDEQDKIISLKIIKAENLLLDSYVIHPMVKIYILDENGEYLKKSQLDRDIMHSQETKTIDYITPVMTKPFNLQENRKIYPHWNETLIINESYQYFLKQESLIMFFEIIDFYNASFINQKSCDAWRTIAWAFLKPKNKFGANLRLQLFYPSGPNKSAKCQPYVWWSKRKFRKYPSSLHIILKELDPPKKIRVKWRPTGPLETECSKDQVEETREELQENAEEVLAGCKKLENQLCKVPKDKIAELKTGEDGCLTCKFSHSGTQLAISVSDDAVYYILIYSMENFEEVCKLPAHKGLIYEICWSLDDNELICASADCTVSVWDVNLQKYLFMLPHGSYVYTCATTSKSKLIATGCFDGFVRIWCGPEVLEELQGFNGENEAFVTTLQFSKDASKLFAANSKGCIYIFQGNSNKWSLQRQIKNLYIEDVMINQLLIHKREKRILVSTRDNKIRLIDIKTGFVLQTYSSATVERVLIRCSMSSCGTFVASGSECGNVYFWNTDTGNLEFVMRPFNEQIPINCAQFSPKNNYFFVSHYNNAYPALVYGVVKTSNDGKINHRKLHKRNDDPEVQKDGAACELNNFKLILDKMKHILPDE